MPKPVFVRLSIFYGKIEIKSQKIFIEPKINENITDETDPSQMTLRWFSDEIKLKKSVLD